MLYVQDDYNSDVVGYFFKGLQGATEMEVQCSDILTIYFKNPD